MKNRQIIINNCKLRIEMDLLCFEQHKKNCEILAKKYRKKMEQEFWTHWQKQRSDCHKNFQKSTLKFTVPLVKFWKPGEMTNKPLNTLRLPLKQIPRLV